MSIDDVAGPEHDQVRMYRVECMGVHGKRPKHMFYRNQPCVPNSTGICKDCFTEIISTIPEITKADRDKLIRDTYRGILERPDDQSQV